MQHRGLQRMATTDMRVVQALLEAVKVLRPEFGSFDWLVEEVRTNCPPGPIRIITSLYTISVCGATHMYTGK